MNQCRELDHDFILDTQSPSGSDLDSSKLASLPRIPIWNFRSCGTVLHAKIPVEVELSRLDVTSLAENERLGIIATGDSFEEALQDFQDQLVHLYKYFGQMKDSELTEKAKVLKTLLINNFDALS